MKKKIILLHFFIFFLVVSRIFAQDLVEGPAGSMNSTQSRILTLEKCIELALKNSTELKAQRHELVALEENKKALLWEPFSMFDIEGKFSMVPDKCAVLEDGLLTGCNGGLISSDENISKSWGPSFHLRARGTIPIPTSNKMSSGKKALEEGIKAKEKSNISIKHEIRYNVHRAFHAITGAREMLYTLSEGRKHLEGARKKIEINLENQEGTETEIDLVKLKVFEAQLEALEQEIFQMEQQGLAALTFLVGLPRNIQIDIPDDPQQIVETPILPIEEYFKKAIENRPELDALRHAINAYEAKISFQRADYVPDLAFVVLFRWAYTPGVNFSQSYTNSDGNTQRSESVPFVYRDSYNYSTTAPAMALVMRYPLNFGIKKHKLGQARAELAAVTAQRQRAIDGIMLEVETSYIEITSTNNAIDALNRSRRMVRGWLTAAVTNHASGLGSSNEVKDALKEYFGIMAQIHQKIGGYNIGLARLEKAAGLFK